MRIAIHLFFISFCVVIFGYSCKNKKESESASVNRTKDKVHSQKPKRDQAKSKSAKSNQADLKTILGLSEKQIRNNKLYSFIDDWYGVPYKYGGCKKSGVDCSCFINILYESVYDQVIANTAADIYKSCDKITLDNAREGDFVFFKINGNYVSHIGVLLQKKNFVHASTSRGVMVSNLDEAYFKKYFHSAGRLKNI